MLLHFLERSFLGFVFWLFLAEYLLVVLAVFGLIHLPFNVAFSCTHIILNSWEQESLRVPVLFGSNLAVNRLLSGVKLSRWNVLKGIHASPLQKVGQNLVAVFNLVQQT